MQIIEKTYPGQKPLYPVEKFCPEDKALFIDIETTGLQKETTSLYLIGCGFYSGCGFETKLFFADSETEELKILLEFSAFAARFSHLFHFNGVKFDIPYLEYKAKKYGLDDPFKGLASIDIYRLCKPLRYLLFPDTMKQKAIETFLGIERVDRYGGGELISVYKEYTATHSDSDLELLITHNREDVLGMHLIMPILYYLDLKDAPMTYRGYRQNSYSDLYGEEKQEVIFDYHTTVSFPVSFAAKTETMYVKANAQSGDIAIRLPLYTDEMKIFFDNYRDYCYLPEEDNAILRSIASSLPKDRYVKATNRTCYQRVSGTFLKQPDAIFTPVLKTEYGDKRKFFRFPDGFNEETAEEFGRQLINIFFTMKKR